MRRLAGGDPSAGGLLAEASRRLGLRPPGTLDEDPAGAVALREAAALGLRPDLAYDESADGGRTVTLRVALPSAQVGPAHLRAVVGLVLHAVRELAGEGRCAAGPSRWADRPRRRSAPCRAATRSPSTRSAASPRWSPGSGRSPCRSVTRR
ncbi:hypothetical protein MRQ36_00890 [Micromonospora sp. R77]|uniref:hypothetical protein n=1 Tax=Micromonospora sp. R77 TaxID=2925836 RepID=UPI001F620090|nr:hypothetical protein [Micromonospora sp. R77]MCI4061204.1 hypothetical protein [Micromonospora sp. R77]